MPFKKLRIRLLLIVVLVSALPACVAAESASSEFKTGQRAEKKNDLDTAFQAYKKAHDREPADPRYMASYLRLRLTASTRHVRAGNDLHDQGDLQGALAEFRMASQIDPSNFEAMGLVRRTVDEIETRTRQKSAPLAAKQEEVRLNKAAANAAGPIELHFKADLPVSIQMTTTVDVLYKTIGKLGGINILMDPDYKPQKITFELKDVTLRDALDMLAIQSKTFWRPLSPNTILVAADTGSKRKELEQSVMKTFYLRNAATPEDLQAAAGTLKGILDISHIQVTPEQRSLTLRGTPDQMIFAQKLLSDPRQAQGRGSRRHPGDGSQPRPHAHPRCRASDLGERFHRPRRRIGFRFRLWIFPHPRVIYQPWCWRHIGLSSRREFLGRGVRLGNKGIAKA